MSKAVAAGSLGRRRKRVTLGKCDWWWVGDKNVLVLSFTLVNIAAETCLDLVAQIMSKVLLQDLANP